MTRSRRRKLVRKAAKKARIPVVCALVAGSQLVHGQQAGTTELQEVIVTAQKRTEDLQQVPISLLVLGNERLSEAQVTAFDDYAKLLPSVSFQSLGPGQAQPYFRGISSGEDGVPAGSLPATGVYLDETPITTIGGSADVHIYDIARVEALAGPQGTLYGASSLSGTLRIITNKPDPSAFSAGYDIKEDKFGAGDHGTVVEGFVNLPVSSNAALRLVGYYEHDGGYISNELASRTYQRGAPGLPNDPLTVTNAAFTANNFNDITEYGGRAALKVDLNDSWTVTPTVVSQYERSNGNFSFDPKVGDLKLSDFEPDSTLDRWYQAALTVEGKISDYNLIYSGGWYQRDFAVDVDYSQYTVAYDALGAGYTRFADAAGNLIDPTQAIRVQNKYTKMTHELRLNTPSSYRLRATVGAFYQRQADGIQNDSYIPGLAAAYAVTGDDLFTQKIDRVDRDYAIFADSTFDVTDKVKLSAGVRGFIARNTLYGFSGFQFSEPQCFAPVIAGRDPPCDNVNASVRESGETHRVNITYQIDPARMVYATYATGFRPGGGNHKFGVVPYNSDTLTNFEVGWKTDWFSKRLRINGALFYERWDGVQLGIPGALGLVSILNAGNARVKGIETDIDWLVTDNLTFAIAATELSAKTTTNFCPSPDGVVTSDCTDPVAPAGTRLPVTPNFKGTATVRYTVPWGAFKNFVQGSALHQSSNSSRLETASNALLGDAPGFTTFDFSLGTSVSNWNVSLYIQNAFDERGQLNRNAACAIASCYANYRIYPIKPQQFGVKFGQKF